MSEFTASLDDAISERNTASDDDEEDDDVDWQRLSSLLSPDAFAALHSHLIGGKGASSGPEVPIVPMTSTATESCVKSLHSVKHTPNNATLKEQGYWDERFAEEDEYDWLLSYEQLQTHLIPILMLSDKILIVGCGNSRLSEGLYDAGFTNITNIDFSDIVIERMKTLHGVKRPLMQWEFMDMTDMTYDAGSFDVVIDKASTDAVMVDEEDVWNPNIATINIIHKMCLGISKILTPQTGRFIQLSFAQPHFRTKYLMGHHMREDSEEKISPFESSEGYCERYGWTLSFSTINTEAGCLNSFLYVMKIK